MNGGGADYNKGHRARLRARFAKTGRQGIADYELLELLLFRVIPRGDVKDTAKELLRRFGSIAGVIGAPPERLLAVPKVGERVVEEVKIIQALGVEMTRSKLFDLPLLASGPALVNYCMTIIGHESVEQFRVFYLNTKGFLIEDEIQQKGTVDMAHIYPREILKRALDLDAKSLILAHNHPGGDPMPSREDIEITRQIADALRGAGILLHDHIIIGRNKYTSMRNQGLIR